MTEISEKKQSLWLLTASPVIWAAHFMLSYITASIWCAKLAGPDKSLGEVRVAIVIYTALWSPSRTLRRNAWNRKKSDKLKPLRIRTWEYEASRRCSAA